MRMLFMGSVVLLAAFNANPPVKSEHAEPDEKVSYGIGYRVGLELRGAPPTIGPKETRVFELTLVAIVNPAEPDGNVQVSD